MSLHKISELNTENVPCLVSGCECTIDEFELEIEVEKLDPLGGTYEIEAIEYFDQYLQISTYIESDVPYNEFVVRYCNAGDDYEANYPGHTHIVYYHKKTRAEDPGKARITDMNGAIQNSGPL
jgi:hypothetical protein